MHVFSSKIAASDRPRINYCVTHKLAHTKRYVILFACKKALCALATYIITKRSQLINSKSKSFARFC